MIDDSPNHGRRPVAYLNETFLESPDARALRILSEYLEPLSHFRDEKIQDTIVFFGSARITEDGSAGRLLSRCATLARLMTEWSSKLRGDFASLRDLFGRRAGHHGSRQSGRGGRGRQDHRAEYRPARSNSDRIHTSRRNCRSSSTTSSCANSGLRIWPRRW